MHSDDFRNKLKVCLASDTTEEKILLWHTKHVYVFLKPNANVHAVQYKQNLRAQSLSRCCAADKTQSFCDFEKETFCIAFGLLWDQKSK